MDSTKSEAKADRRNFLKLAGIGTVGSAAALVTGKKAEAAEPAPKAGSGYAETDHVKAFYKSARF